MKRKVNRVGTNTLTVSLPTKWTKNNNIVKGDELLVEEEGNKLTILKGKNNKKSEKKIVEIKGDNYLERFIAVPCIHGYDEVKVIFDSPDVIARITRSVNRFIGFEIVEQDEKSCLIKNIAPELEEDFQVTFNRLIHVVSTISTEFRTFIENEDKTKFKTISGLRDLARKFQIFCARLIHKNIETDSCNFQLYYIVNVLQSITWDFKEAYRLYSEGNANVNKCIKEYVKIADNNIQEITTILLSEEKKDKMLDFKKYHEANYNPLKKIDISNKEAPMYKFLTEIIGKSQMIGYQI
jgi:phosphate uptake regulator